MRAIPRALCLAAASLASLALGGCASTHVTGSAPGPKDGTMYVTGLHGGKPMIWLCPTTPGKKECLPVEVEETEP